MRQAAIENIILAKVGLLNQKPAQSSTYLKKE